MVLNKVITYIIHGNLNAYAFNKIYIHIQKKNKKKKEENKRYLKVSEKYELEILVLYIYSNNILIESYIILSNVSYK